jgi:hypothetical protein
VDVDLFEVPSIEETETLNLNYWLQLPTKVRTLREEEQEDGVEVLTIEEWMRRFGPPLASIQLFPRRS